MTITIVVPCYNEQEVLPWSIAQLLSLTDRLRHDTGDEARLRSEEHTSELQSQR